MTTPHDPAYNTHVCQFSNNGAICWFNSIMQMFLRCTPLTKYLIENEDQMETTFARMYLSFAKRLLTGTSSGDQYESIRLVNNMIRTLRECGISSGINISGQQCADEGFHMIITALAGTGDNEVTAISKIFATRYISRTYCSGCPPSVDSFGRQQPGISYENSKHPPDTTIQFEFYPSDVKTPDGFAEKIINNVSWLQYYKCDICGQQTYQSSVILHQLRLLSSVIVIRNMNVNVHGSGISLSTDDVWYPEEFWLPYEAPDGVSDDVPKKNRLKYRLFANVIHHGGQYANVVPDRQRPGAFRRSFTSSGHYTCDVRCNDQWMNANDSTLTNKTFEMNKRSYLLMYILVE